MRWKLPMVTTSSFSANRFGNTIPQALLNPSLTQVEPFQDQRSYRGGKFTDLSHPQEYRRCEVDAEITALLDSVPSPTLIFTSDELNAAISRLMPKKAGGIDNLAPIKHILHTGPVPCRLILLLLNNFIHHIHIPESFKKSLILPIH